MLILQAAHQPSAGTRDPQRVDRQVLVLGHPHGDRLEVLEECGAAQVTPARPDPALQPGLIPGADLPQLDPAPQPGRQIADERAEVDPSRRTEVHREDVRRIQVVHADDLHRQAVLADQPPGRRLGLGPPGLVGPIPCQVLIVGQPGADRHARYVLVHPLRCPHALGHFGSAVGGHENVRPHGRHARPRVHVVEPAIPLETDGHHHAHRHRLRGITLDRPSGQT